MDYKSQYFLVLLAYIVVVVGYASGRHHGLKYHHNQYNHLHNSYRNHHQYLSSTSDEKELSKPHHHQAQSTQSTRRLSDDYEDDDYDGRHAYLMINKNRKSSEEKLTEDHALTKAFERHMKSGTTNLHDVYAYQLPSDLWFVVRYVRSNDGNVEKYMNVVDSFSNYLEKLDEDVRTVSVNVKGVETVFRLTPKRKPDN